MIIENKEKKMLKDMLPIEIKVLHNTPKSDVEFYARDNSWFPYSYSINHAGGLNCDSIYRAKQPKPKALSPNELFNINKSIILSVLSSNDGDCFDRKSVLMVLNDIQENTAKLEGFKGE